MKWLKRFTLFICWTVAICIIILAIGLNLMRFSLPYLNKPREQLQSWVSATLHVPVKIKTVEAYWRGLEPVLEFADVEVLDKNNKYILGQMHYLRIEINLMDSLLHRKILPGRVVVNGCRFTLHQKKNGRLVFIKPEDEGADLIKGDDHRLALSGMLMWLMKQSNIVVRRVDIRIDLQNHKTLQVKNLRLDANHGEINQLQGKATLLQPQPSQLTFVYKPDRQVELEDVSGKLYLNLASFRLKAWAPVFGFLIPKPSHQYTIDGGVWDGKIWVDWDHNKLKSTQVVGTLRNLIWHDASVAGKKLQVKHISGNAYWEKMQHGWKFSVGALDVRSDALHLGQYMAAVQYQNKPSEIYAVKIQKFDFSQLEQWYHSPLKRLLPERIWKQQQMYQPRGVLNKLSFTWQKPKRRSAKSVQASALSSLSAIKPVQLTHDMVNRVAYSSSIKHVALKNAMSPAQSAAFKNIIAVKKSVASEKLIISKKSVASKKSITSKKSVAAKKIIASKKSVQGKENKKAEPKLTESLAARFFKHIDQISFDGSDLGWREQSGIPGVTGLNGYGSYQPDHAKLTITSAYHTKIKANKLFSKPLVIDSLRGQMDWAKKNDGWGLHWSGLELKSKGLFVQSAGDVIQGEKGGTPTMSNTTHFNLKDASHLKDFLPDIILHKELRHWLRRAFVAGAIDRGEFVWHGPIYRPASDKSVDKRWKVTLHTDDMRFHYADRWPDLLGMDGEVVFAGTDMHVAAKAHFPSGVKARSIVADIPDLTNAKLTISSRLTGDLQHARDYLINTPLSLRHGMKKMSLAGPFDLQLGLKIPVYDMKKKTGVDGKFKIDHARISLPDWGVEGTDAAGVFTIVDSKLFAHDIKLTMFGKPAVVQVSTREDSATKKSPEKTTLAVDIEGMTTVDGLMHGKKLFFSRHVSGFFPLQGELINLFWFG